MSTPRPSEPDVEALLSMHRLHASMRYCLACRWRPTAGEGGLTEQHARHLAKVLSDYLISRDAEHERKLSALRAEVDDANEHAIECERIGVKALEDRILVELERDEARRALADLRGEIKALADEWEVEAGEDSEAWRVYGPQSVSVPFAVASLRALLLRDDNDNKETQ